MAKKKKKSQQAKDLKKESRLQENQNKQAETLTPQSPVESYAETVDILKSLNTLVLQEAFEKKQQNASLVQATQALESELSLLGNERKELQALLSQKDEKNLAFELERSLILDFFQSQMREICGAFDRVVEEENNGDTQMRILRNEMYQLIGSLREEQEKLIMVRHEKETEAIEMKKKERKNEEFISELKKEQGILMERIREKENEIKDLVKERDLLEKRETEAKKSLSTFAEKAMMHSSEMQREMEKLRVENEEITRLLETSKKVTDETEKSIAEKNELEKSNNESEKVNAEFQKKTTGLDHLVSDLQEACRDHEKENRKFREARDRATVERDDALKQLEEQRADADHLFSKVSEMERTIEEITEESKKLRRGGDELREDNHKLGREISHLRDEVKSITTDHERALGLMKKTASLICISKDEIEAETPRDDIDTYVAAMETVKKDFQRQEKEVQDMKLHVEGMKKSLAEEKRKTFWAMVLSSAAATIFATGSIAFAAGLH